MEMHKNYVITKLDNFFQTMIMSSYCESKSSFNISWRFIGLLYMIGVEFHSVN